MRRRTIMTIGFLLMFIGIQLNVVRTYTLTPKATKFWMENIEEPALATQPPMQQMAPQQMAPQAQAAYNGYANSPFSQASYGNGANAYGANYAPMQVPAPRPAMYGPKQFSPPEWICWPFIFVGTAFVLYGLILARH